MEPSQLSNSLGVIESTAIATNGGEGVAAMKGGKGGQEALLSTGATNVFINSFTSAITVVVISESASGMTSVRV